LLEEINEDAHIVTILKEHGGIPFVKSNVPIMAFSYHTSNHIFGTGENPWNWGRSIGGSCGGEAGLVSSKCSPFGIGSDAGGSIWVPSSFCGIVGFVPTAKWVSLYGHRVYTGAHHYAVEPANILIGPLARNVEDANLVFKLSLDTHRLNQALVKVPYNQDLYDQTQNQKLKIGVWMGIEKLHGLCPSITRALKETSILLWS